jgi:hypothetical protein
MAEIQKVKPMARYLSIRDQNFVASLLFKEIERDRGKRPPKKKVKVADPLLPISKSKYEHLKVHLLCPPPKDFDFLGQYKEAKCIYCPSQCMLFYCLKCYVTCCDDKKHAFKHEVETGHKLFLFPEVEEPTILYLQGGHHAAEDMDITDPCFTTVLRYFDQKEG